MGILRNDPEDLASFPEGSAKCFICGEALVTNVDGKRSVNPGGFWATTTEEWVFLCPKEHCVERAMHLVIDALYGEQIRRWAHGAGGRERLKEAANLLGEKLQKVFWYKATQLITTEKPD